jgi:hypothetical protein
MKHTFLQMCFLFIICFSSNIYSVLICSEKKVDFLKSEGKEYSFEATTKCYFQSQDLPASILKSYLKEIKSDPQITVLELQPESNYGYNLKIIQKVDYGHGKMTIDADLNISHTSTEFSFIFDSNKIKAKGNAAYTVDIIETALLKKEDNSYQVTLKKQAKIEKPWFAPEFVFIDEVKEGLSQDLDYLIKYHSSALTTD